MKQVAITAGVFIIASACLLGLYSVSVRFSRVANDPGVKACFTTTCQDPSPNGQ